MKTTRIEITGENGAKATIRRVGEMIEVRFEDDQLWMAKATGLAGVNERVELSRALQERLDGYHGTSGDVDDYYRAIENFAD